MMTRFQSILTAALAFASLGASIHHGQSATCNAGNARDNRSSPFRRGYDFVPITTDDSLGFYVVYSERVPPSSSGSTADVGNTAGIYIFELSPNEIMIFGAGYGNHNVATNNVHYDVQRVVEVVEGCMGFSPSQTLVRFTTPHGHGDHINPQFLRELQSVGFLLAEVVFHAGDQNLVNGLSGWTTELRNMFIVLRGGNPAYGYPCGQELASYDSTLGKIWFVWRGGHHTNGAMDLVIDVRDNPRDRFVVMGSGSGGNCSGPPSGTRQRIRAHGNVLLSVQPEVVKYGCRNPEPSLRVLRGLPKPGTTMTFGVDNPFGTQTPGAIAHLGFARKPDTKYPCGTPSAALGMSGVGERLLSLRFGSYLGSQRALLPWAGQGIPAEVNVDIPNDPALVGMSVYIQGVLVDPNPLTPTLGATSAVEIRIAP